MNHPRPQGDPGNPDTVGGQGRPIHLPALREALRISDRPSTRRRGGYLVPSVWVDPYSPPGSTEVDPFEFHLRTIDRLIDGSPGAAVLPGDWSRSAVVFNMLVRLTCAWDHDADGTLGIPVNGTGWRETGTFLKAIAILPYINSLGADTIHLLPVQEIGKDGRRGNLGSPYAVRDPYAIDPMLGEPLLGLPVATQFSAFIEAAHLTGLRVVLELPLRTQSKDSVWAGVNPDWFYWIEEGARFKPPSLSTEEVRRATQLVEVGDFDRLPLPPPEYRSMFSPPPDPATVRIEEDRWVGSVPGRGNVVIPGAFADWPPDDHQPVWDDVTYLKLYQDGRYNYQSYNTVRMYDSSLLNGGTETEKLWEELAAMVADYAAKHRIDGLMVDMAHAIPAALARRIIERARGVNPSFAFWAEDFSRTVAQAEAGYNAVLGGQWACQHRRVDFRDMLAWLGRTPELLPHLAAPETHNTPRAAARQGGETYAGYAWEVSCFIPGIPFIHSGFDVGERLPVNTGLGFTADELRRFPADVLPLFSAAALRWDEPGEPRSRIRRALALRRRLASCIVPPDASFRLVDAGDDRVIAFVRASPDRRQEILVAANSDPVEGVRFRAMGTTGAIGGEDLLGGGAFASTGGTVEGALAPGQVAVFAADAVKGE